MAQTPAAVPAEKQKAQEAAQRCQQRRRSRAAPPLPWPPQELLLLGPLALQPQPSWVPKARAALGGSRLHGAQRRRPAAAIRLSRRPLPPFLRTLTS